MSNAGTGLKGVVLDDTRIALVDGEQGKLWSELGLELKPAVRPYDRWLRNGTWVTSPWEDETIARLEPALQKPMLAIRRAIAGIEAGKDFPETPYTSLPPKPVERFRCPD